MATWRLAGAATLLLGDALDLLLPPRRGSGPDPAVALEALRGRPLVRVVAADLVPPRTVLRHVLGPAAAGPGTLLELRLVGSGERRRPVWLVDAVRRTGHVRRAVDGHEGSVLPCLPPDGDEPPAALLLTRGRAPLVCDLAAWARCVTDLPVSLELWGAGTGLWERLCGGAASRAPRTHAEAPPGKV